MRDVITESFSWGQNEVNLTAASNPHSTVYDNDTQKLGVSGGSYRVTTLL